ncbi:multidrug MFS transporter [Ktedonobacter sp. SOSP1-52]|uniref:epoxide hydrolase family protein n=1 Tax=Ktedonobacter sp. SOSP1-52 TaxID=2778366 RepID=UPI0019157D8F|nr:epoxide hydrolase family protein [Ktedonobacter sp. SOSP1-52]GHO61945.1 multidrug MFS transporter [Ktedonobacter sp. SOSP1-52]
MSMQPFKIAIPQATLDDLRERLARTRWLSTATEADWAYGISLEYMKELADHWLHEYDWRKHETALNSFAQFKTDVDGVGIHFIHERGKGPNPTPLLLLHGFPDSFYRYHKVIERLTDPAKFGCDPNASFDVIVPSIPGTGFSDRVTVDDDTNADLFAKLMTQVLGYEKFFSAGGDHGAIITQTLARKYPELLIGIHLTDVGYPDQNTDFSTLTPAEMEMAQWVQKWFMEEGIGVNMIMATKPQTLAYGLNDSPLGLAAWLIGYGSSGEKGKEEFKTRFSADELLTNVTIYWVTETINTAAGAYYANAHVASGGNLGKSTVVPAAVAHCPYDPPLPREWAARQVNLIHFTDFPRGGHFMAWEEPELYVADLQSFVRQILK